MAEKKREKKQAENQKHTANQTGKTVSPGILKVAVAAASDRYNFGDVLLPIVFEQYLKRAVLKRGERREIQVSQFALFNADLTSVGGMKVRALSKADSSYDCVVIAGGEVLAAGYITMHLSTGPGKALTAAERLLRKIPLTRPLLERFLQKAVCRRDNAGMPWMYHPLRPDQKVFYNAVGGAGFAANPERARKEWKEVISSSAMFSVRDRKTLDGLNQSGITRSSSGEIEMIPDTAIVMDSFYTDEVLRREVRQEYMELAGKDYFVLQVSNNIGRNILDEVGRAVKTVCEEQNLRCVLLPIGRAARHDDIIPLSALHRRLPGITTLIGENNISETIWIISRAKFYVGSSLHGAITAMSFHTPHTALTRESGKLRSYLEQWETTACPCVDSAGEIAAFADRALHDPSVIDCGQIDAMKKTVEDWLDRVAGKCLEQDQQQQSAETGENN